ncbi:hypothetical protein I6G82_21850 [Lysinibacillus macroides]|uniref:DUF1641 domain-containing protein n=1 Tax=Lysinibacillus macroides TaxID=33935 RepID=A0A0N0UWL6_9BACI|nr:hypothetical protein [Lysinibacillus macroides]KOY81684.1 hypothetical protein ADM90_12190 [Lysinibacillus macroides]QPR67789.1 hypothetical protein I6G82_21850 [Lysinibacillus macroides]
METMETNPIQMQLQQPETQQAIAALLANLPTYQKNLETLGNVIEFGQAALTDQQAIQKYDELVRSYNIDFETFEALIQLLEKLPRLVQLLEQLEDITDFISAVLKDEKTLEVATNSLKAYAEPVFSKVSLLKEIQEQAEAQTEPIKLFTIINWLKDPSVQKMLKYIQATLLVLKK